VTTGTPHVVDGALVSSVLAIGGAARAEVIVGRQSKGVDTAGSAWVHTC
jgi:hypothetical protein